MSRVEIDRCNCCGKETKDRYAEVGWIKIDDTAFHVNGGRGKEGSTNVVRYINKLNAEDLDFCCVTCLLDYLYFSDGHFNSDVKTYADFIKKMELKNVSIPRKLYKSIVLMFDVVNAMTDNQTKGVKHE